MKPTKSFIFFVLLVFSSVNFIYAQNSYFGIGGILDFNQSSEMRQFLKSEELPTLKGYDNIVRFEMGSISSKQIFYSFLIDYGSISSNQNTKSISKNNFGVGIKGGSWLKNEKKFGLGPTFGFSLGKQKFDIREYDSNIGSSTNLKDVKLINSWNLEQVSSEINVGLRIYYSLLTNELIYLDAGVNFRTVRSPLNYVGFPDAQIEGTKQTLISPYIGICIALF